MSKVFETQHLGGASAPAKTTMPTRRLIDPKNPHEYVPAAETDIKKLFDRIFKEQK